MKQDLQRRLGAVLFTDMVGYTALIQADELLAVDKRDRYIRARSNATTSPSAGPSSSVSATAA